MADDPQTGDLTPSPRTVPLQSEAFPDSLCKKIAVPEELINAGRNTNLPRDVDSPETLDDDLTRGSDREAIDPQHSVDYNKTADDSTSVPTGDSNDDRDKADYTEDT